MYSLVATLGTTTGAYSEIQPLPKLSGLPPLFGNQQAFQDGLAVGGYTAQTDEKAAEAWMVVDGVESLPKLAETLPKTLEELYQNLMDLFGSGDGDAPSADWGDWVPASPRTKGTVFNEARAWAYPFNEVYVDTPTGRYILDSYNPQLGEIVSRKFTQLSEISETALSVTSIRPRIDTTQGQQSRMSRRMFETGWWGSNFKARPSLKFRCSEIQYRRRYSTRHVKGVL